MHQRNELRSAANGTGDRSDKVRTYNFPQVRNPVLSTTVPSCMLMIWRCGVSLQDRVTDHRVGVTVPGVSRILSGEMLSTITTALMDADESERISNFLAKISSTGSTTIR